MSYELDIVAGPSASEIDLQQLEHALVQVLEVEAVAEAVLSITLTDNKTIHQLNQHYLQHDFATDVISFPLDWRHPQREFPDNGPARRSEGARIEGEIVASVELARSMADRFGWSVQSELTLYVIHGMLHICGYDDLDPAERSTMRCRESAILTGLGLRPAGERTPDGEGAEPERQGTSTPSRLPADSPDDLILRVQPQSTRSRQEGPE